MIRVFDAFSGIGGFRSALERVGEFKTVGWCEIDKYAQKSYQALFDTKGEIFYEDITKIDYGSISIFTGGMRQGMSQNLSSQEENGIIKEL